MTRGGGARLPCSPSPTLTSLPRRTHESPWGRGGVGGRSSGGLWRAALDFSREGHQLLQLTLSCLLLPQPLWSPEPPSSLGEGERARRFPKWLLPLLGGGQRGGREGEGCRAALPPPRLALLPGADRYERRSVGRTPADGGRGRPCAHAGAGGCRGAARCPRERGTCRLRRQK